MSIDDPQEQTLYPETGASAHMTLFDGNLACKSTYMGSTKFIVGNGALLPISIRSVDC